MKLIKGEFKEKLDLQLAPSIRAGFPSPAEDYLSESIDFNRDMIKHPEATFYGEVEGDSMIGLGINDGDIAVIDRSIEAEQGDIVVAYINGEFNVKQFRSILISALMRVIISECGEWSFIPSKDGSKG